MMIALMKSRKIPKVTIVIGSVSMTKIGFTINRNSAITTATIKAVKNEVTPTPGSKYPKMITANAVSNNLIKVFIRLNQVKVNYLRASP